MPISTPKQLTKKVAVIQSNYVPWIGYFAIMASVDLFIVYECVKYTKNDWRNRNQLQTSDGRLTWLSIPIRQYSTTQAFMETKVAHHDWASSHLGTLHHHFAHTQGWARWRDELASMYSNAAKMTHLFEINRLFLNWGVRALDISTPLVYLDSYPIFNDPNERLISILKNFGATHYMSGPAAQNYIKPDLFTEAKIDLSYVNYDQLLKDMLISPQHVKNTSVLQLILEGNYEFRCD